MDLPDSFILGRNRFRLQSLSLWQEIASIRTHGNLFINSKRRRFRSDINEPFSLMLVVHSLIYFAFASALAWYEWGLERLSIPWYFSYSLLATMLHTLVLLVQFVGDHADLEALVEAT